MIVVLRQSARERVLTGCMLEDMWICSSHLTVFNLILLLMLC